MVPIDFRTEIHHPTRIHSQSESENVPAQPFLLQGKNDDGPFLMRRMTTAILQKKRIASIKSVRFRQTEHGTRIARKRHRIYNLWNWTTVAKTMTASQTQNLTKWN
jgi:hypothetical protein